MKSVRRKARSPGALPYTLSDVSLKDAVCDGCPLERSCRKRFVRGERGREYREGGLMFVAEHPAKVDLSKGRPLQGPDGRLFGALLEEVGLSRDEVYITHAVLGAPPPSKGHLWDAQPEAIYRCIPRLEREIEEARPGVIVTLGQGALAAVLGRELVTTKLQPFACERCDEGRKIGPVLACAAGACDWFVELDPLRAEEHAKATKAAHDDTCPACEASIKRLRPRRMKCPDCGGRKTRPEEHYKLTCDYVLTGREGVAGAVFDAADCDGPLTDYGVRYIVPTYHPFFIRRAMNKEKLGGSNYRVGGQFAANPWAFHVEKAIELCRREPRFDAPYFVTRDPEVVRWYLAPSGRYTVDVETNKHEGAYRSTKIVCIGFDRAGADEVMVVDTRHIEKDLWKTGYRSAHADLLDVMDDFFQRQDVGTVFHNGIFDRGEMLNLWGLPVSNVVSDTMLAHTVCYPDEEHGLGFVAHELTDAPAWKGAKKVPAGTEDDNSGYPSFEALCEYNAKDLRATTLVDQRLCGADGRHGLMTTDGNWRVHDLDLRMYDIAVEMQANGLFISKARQEEVRGVAAAQADEHLRAMRKIVGRSDWSPTKYDDLYWALHDSMGPCHLPHGGYTRTGKVSMTKDYLVKHVSHPFVDHLLKWKGHSYHLSHYIMSPALKPSWDGRIHPAWKPAAARTGRWSSSPNFQNWPKYMRTMIVPPPGRKIVGADYSQLELRIMASLSGDPELIRRCAEADESDKLNPDKDPHAFVASITFGDVYTAAFEAHRVGDTGGTKRCDALRTIIKRTVYGLNYGSGAATVLDAIYDGGYEGPPITVAVIERVIETYFELFPSVLTWREATLAQAYEEARVEDPITGRHRTFPLGDVEATVAYNYPIQSSANSIMCLRLIPIFEQLSDVDPSAMLIAQVHDAVYVECDEARARDVARFVEETLTVDWALVEGAPSMPFVASAAISDNWKEAA